MDRKQQIVTTTGTEMKRSLTRFLVNTAADHSILDEEDCELLVKHTLNEISLEELRSMITQKAARLEAQIIRPQ